MAERKPLVLIADDEQNAVVLLTRIFERDGFVVENARDGEIALEKARRLRPDLILMDVQMPKVNGFEVTRQLREDPATARIPVIFVTAAAREPSDVAHGLKLGADDYIRKPYNYHELLARAQSKMRARQLEDRLQRRSEELEALVRIGGVLNQQLELEDLATLILQIASQEFHAAFAELVLFDPQGAPILLCNSRQGMVDPDEALAMLDDPGSLVAQVYRSGEPLLIPGPGAPNRDGLSPAMAAPLKHHGKLLGTLSVGLESERRLSESDLRMLRSMGEQAALAVRNAQLYAELQSYAQTLEDKVERRSQELQAAQAELIRAEKLAALGRMAAGIAHEVNNPLQPILNCLEVAIEDTENGTQPDPEILRVAENEVQRIKSIVSRLLDFARPGNTDQSLVDLPALVGEVLLLTSKQLERAGVRIAQRLYAAPMIPGSPTQLKQVLLNLVLNAMEAMPDGGDLEVMLYAENGGAVISVRDTGIGMDAETVAQIFDPFYSTKGEGTGLGLAVTYGIVEGHGGTIQVESQPGQGARFTIWLPGASS
ncbi:MAG: ATP-binding protein [Chloroflexota bacterium]|jgi:signal transduction histidine kinase/DNA-binding response OmpR family regulator|nr:response regulator [Aggregatilineaceae bacterium]